MILILMFPWGHLAVGYLLYTVWSRVRFREPPASGPTVALAIGTQFPDLLDKPLNLLFGVYDGRAIGHSLLVMVPVCLVLLVVARQYGYGRPAGAFGLGVVTHPFGDAKWDLVNGQFVERAGYILWPLFPAPTYSEATLVGHLSELREYFAAIDPTSIEFLLTPDLLLVMVLVGIWLYDGYPGIATLRRMAARFR